MRPILVFVAIVIGAQAQRPGSFVSIHPLLSALDTNRDGLIDAAELEKAPSVLRKLDRDGDGRITPEEMSPMMGHGRGGRGREEGGPADAGAIDEVVKTYLAFDKNGEGKLTRDELPERMQGIFERGDTNQDGVLSAAELHAMAQAQRQPVEGRGGEGRGGRGPEGMMRTDPIFQALDTNHDNVISGDEITNAASTLKSLDKNQDGSLSEDEVRPNFGRGPGRGRG